MKHLDVQDLRFSRGSFDVHASIALEKGQIGVILGPSGGGKTTLLRLIAGLEQMESGAIYLGGRRIEGLPPEKRNISFMFQDLALFDHLNGRDNLCFGLKQHRVPESKISEIVENLADKFQIRALLSKKPWAMSGGEKQRLACARALAVDPGLLLLDEPFSSLDAPLRRELRGYLRSRLAENGTTALHVTHDVDEAMELGDVLFLMNHGSLVVAGEPEAICSNPVDAWCVSLLGLGFLAPVDALRPQGSQMSAFCGKVRFTLPVSHCKAMLPGLSNPPAYLFCPRGLPRLVSGDSGAAGGDFDAAAKKRLAEDARHGKDASGGNTFDAVARRVVVVDGFKKKVVFAPEGLSPTTENVGPDGSSLPFEMELPSGVSLMAGERLKIYLDPEDCWILPAHAK